MRVSAFQHWESSRPAVQRCATRVGGYIHANLSDEVGLAVKDICRIIVMQHKDQLLMALITAQWSQCGRKNKTGMAFWYPALFSCPLWLSHFKVQATQTHHHRSSDCCSISRSKHRIISHWTWFLGQSCFTLQASFSPSREKNPYTNG